MKFEDVARVSLAQLFEELGVREGYYWQDEEPEPNPPKPTRKITAADLADDRFDRNGQYQVGKLKQDSDVFQNGVKVGVMPAGTRGTCRWPDNSTNTMHVEFTVPRSVNIEGVIPAVKKANQTFNVLTSNIQTLGKINL